jgi:hypothetical protein
MLETVACLAEKFSRAGAYLGLVTNARLIGSRAGRLPAGKGPERFGDFLCMLARAASSPVCKTGFNLTPVAEAAKDAAAVVYCGALPGENAPAVRTALPARVKTLCVYSRLSADGDCGRGGFSAEITAGEVCDFDI